ncbi:hypothetical protein ACRAWF_11515 [Streptomyces sp. L7]
MNDSAPLSPDCPATASPSPDLVGLLYRARPCARSSRAKAVEWGLRRRARRVLDLLRQHGR